MEPQLPPPDYDDIARRVENGDYFAENKSMYTTLFIDPLAERYLYVFITAMASAVFLLMAVAIYNFLPLSAPAPFPFLSTNVLEDLPSIKPLRMEDETPNQALARYMAQEYVLRREAYDINTLELNVRFIKSTSNEAVFNAWQKELDPANPQSPIARYQRITQRLVKVVRVDTLPDGRMEVLFDASLQQGLTVSPPERFAATVAFQFNDVTVEKPGGGVAPLAFTVIDYFSRRAP